MRVAVGLLGEADAIERRQLPDPLPDRLGLVKPERRTHAASGCERGLDQVRPKGLRSRHEQSFRLGEWSKVFRPFFGWAKPWGEASPQHFGLLGSSSRAESQDVDREPKVSDECNTVDQRLSACCVGQRSLRLIRRQCGRDQPSSTVEHFAASSCPFCHHGSAQASTIKLRYHCSQRRFIGSQRRPLHTARQPFASRS